MFLIFFYFRVLLVGYFTSQYSQHGREPCLVVAISRAVSRGQFSAYRYFHGTLFGLLLYYDPGSCYSRHFYGLRVVGYVARGYDEVSFVVRGVLPLAGRARCVIVGCGLSGQGVVSCDYYGLVRVRAGASISNGVCGGFVQASHLHASNYSGAVSRYSGAA